MKILIHYKDIEDFENLKLTIHSLDLKIYIDETSNCEELMGYYDNEHYDIVFIDYSCEFADDLLNQIVTQNPKQRLIIMNDSNDCIDNKNCTLCQKNYNIATVIKPMNQFQIGNILSDDFKCENCNKTQLEFNLERVIKYSLDKYPFVNFNKRKNYFDLSLTVNPLKTTILIDLINQLEENSIKHYIEENGLKIEA